ncbi:MAG: cyclase family protein [Eubacteriales bacterium]|nr:cyclase family protein [Eubacteriales bacterium]
MEELLRNYTVVDLTLTLDEKLPGPWPTHSPIQRKVGNWYQEDKDKEGVSLSADLGPYYTDLWTIDVHTGTHFDAPSHFIPKPETGFANACPAGEITGELVNVNQLMGPAVVIDVTELTGKGTKGESPYIMPAHILAWEKNHGTIPEGSVVLFRSGWDQFYVKGEEGKKFAYNPLIKQEGPGWPSPGVEAMELLIQRGVRCVGTDGTSMGAAHCGMPVHLAGLSKGVLFVESLTNLDKMNASGDFFIFLPVKLAESSGAFGRAVAFVKK